MDFNYYVYIVDVLICGFRDLEHAIDYCDYLFYSLDIFNCHVCCVDNARIVYAHSFFDFFEDIYGQNESNNN